MQILLLMALVATAETSVPNWAKRDQTHYSNGVYETVCSDTAPSVDQARRQAIAACKSGASEYLSKKVEFKNLIIETEKDVALHSESISHVVTEGLICIPGHEEVQENRDSFTVWIQCKFDLNHAASKEVRSDSQSAQTGSSIKSAKEIEVRQLASLQDKVESRSKSISVSSIPACDDILIKGLASRIVKCDKNPISLVVTKSDTEVIVRKSQYKSKTISITDIFENKQETIDVIFAH